MEDIIRSIVCMNPKNFKCNSRYKYTIKRFIADKKKTSTNEEVVWDILYLLDEYNILDNFDDTKSSLSTYVIMRLYYIILREYNTTTKPVIEIPSSDYIETLGEFIDPDDKIYELELFDCIRDYIGPEIFDLKLEGMRQCNIADRLGRTYHSLRTYMYRKRLGLLNHIKSKGFSLEDVSDTILERLAKS